MSDETPPTGPSADEIRQLSSEEAMVAAAELDGFTIVHRRDRFPVRGTNAEKRAERAVAACFVIAALGGLGFIVYFCAGTWHWELPGNPQTFQLFTPILGITLAIMLIFFGIGMVLWAKLLMPEEEVVQDRHDLPTSPEEEILLTEATLKVGLEDTGLPRRSLILRSLGLAGGALATVPLFALVGGLVKDPTGDTLIHTMWRKNKKFPKGVPAVYSDWRRVSVNDLQPGGIATIFPGIRQENEYGFDGVTDASSPTLLIRLRPDQKFKARKGQENFGWPPEDPEYVAFSKICTHAGCPASLYEQQTGRLLCPCHQSQFQVLEDAKPVFGPATRSLPQLPLGVELTEDGQQYFVARADFPEPIGPGFWNRK